MWAIEWFLCSCKAGSDMNLGATFLNLPSLFTIKDCFGSFDSVSPSSVSSFCRYVVYIHPQKEIQCIAHIDPPYFVDLYIVCIHLQKEI